MDLIASRALAVAGAICILYGISVRMIRSGTGFYMVWLALGAILLLGAWAVSAGWWASWPQLLRRATLAIAGAALAVCAVTQGLAISCFGAEGEPGLDCIVVLGAQVREDGPSAVLRYRLDAARTYLDANPGTRCIVSGGKGANEPRSEAEVMAQYLVTHGIDAARITEEGESLNTVGNIRNSMQFLDPAAERVGIVTNDFHVFRGTAIARKQGLRHVCGIAAYSSPQFLPNNLLRETFGISKDFLQGNI